MLLRLSFLSVVWPFAQAYFSDGFRQFLYMKYGPVVEKNLSRADFGDRGAFGGGNRSVPLKTKNTPVVIVHGLGNVAGDYWELKNEFLRRGYGMDEIYSTTYGHIREQFSISNRLECAFIRQVRQLIQAVIAYTKSPVYVIGNSLGGAVSRKAILGGICVDTKENLGPSITNAIKTYMGVAGAMRGARMCEGFFSDIIPICNKINGLNPGSYYIRDTNSRSGYESRRVLVLESKDDDVIFFESSKGVRLMEVARMDRIVLFHNLTHERTVFGTQTLQYDLLISNEPT